MKKTLLLLLMAGLLSLSGSCNFDGLGYVRDLQETLANKYKAEEIHVKINNKQLIVTLKNSPLEDLSVEEKLEIAMEIGVLALAPEQRPDLESGKLIFEDKTELGVTEFSDSHSFDMQLEK